MLSAREQNFFEFFLSEIEKVNKWYFEQASLFRTKLNSMERQVSFLYSNFYSFLHLFLYELYRGFIYLKNFSVLNKMAVDKILKKHDKTALWVSRATVINMMKQLAIYDNKPGITLSNAVENLWGTV